LKFDGFPPPEDAFGSGSVTEAVHRDGINLAAVVNRDGLVLTNLPIKPDDIFRGERQWGGRSELIDED